MGKQLSLDDLGPFVEESKENPLTTDKEEEFESHFRKQLLEAITGDNITLFLSYCALGATGEPLSDFLYLKADQVVTVANQIAVAGKNDWISILNEDGSIKGMFKNSPNLVIVKFINFNK